MCTENRSTTPRCTTAPYAQHRVIEIRMGHWESRPSPCACLRAGMISRTKRVVAPVLCIRPTVLVCVVAFTPIAVHARSMRRLPVRRNLKPAGRIIKDSGEATTIRLLRTPVAQEFVGNGRRRVEDVDFNDPPIVVRDGTGAPDRMTMAPDLWSAPTCRSLAVGGAGPAERVEPRRAESGVGPPHSITERPRRSAALRRSRQECRSYVRGVTAPRSRPWRSAGFRRHC